MDWGSEVEAGQVITLEQINCGAILRIADALESIAQIYRVLIDERNRYKSWYETERDKNARHWRRQAALRGVITKLKKTG